jgi:hypothetical protein
MKKYIMLLFLAMLGACSGIKVLESETGENADLGKYGTFDFYRVQASGDTISNLFNTRIALLKEAISTELIKRGYMQNNNNPDMLINIGIQVKEKVQTRTTDWRTDGAPRYMGQRNYSWKSQEIEVGSYREGTVTLHLVDAAQNKMVWKGVVQGVIPEKRDNAQKTAQQGMKELFDRFPVPVK